MEPVRFETLYDLLAIELDRDAEKVREGVASNPEALGEAANAVFGARSFPWTLAEPITTAEGSMTLLATGADLGKKVGSIVSRQAKDPDVPIGPVVFMPGDQLVEHYRRMVLSRLTPAIDETKTSPSPVLSRIFGATKGPLHAFMDSTVEKGAARSFATSSGLMTMLSVVRGAGFAERWKLSVESAYVAMAVMGAMSELAEEEQLKPSIEAVGNAALYQDLAVMLKPSLYAKETARHPQRSAQIAGMLGVPPQVCALIELHHSYVSDEAEAQKEGEPKAGGQPKGLPVEAKVLVVANLFMSALHEAHRLGGDIEAIKGLNFMMGEGKIDKRAVVTLTRLYLSHKFALFFEKAMEIAALCPFEGQAEPILWNILGERSPQKFICRFKDCMHLGSQQTLVSQTIPVRFDGKVVSKIRKGEYTSCRYLTNKLGELYKEISQLSTK